MNSQVFDKCSVILLDVAGTIGSINFVKDTLFPYALKHVEEYLKSNWDADNVKEIIAGWKGEDAEFDVAKAVDKFNKLNEQSADDKAFKDLQGLIYKKGYESGDIKAHIFDEVKESLENWSKNRKICVYSTGSEEAQKLYFANTTQGDLSELVHKYFDQSIGAKSDTESYKSIAKALEVQPEEVIFFSDNLEEIKAAESAGCVGVVVSREGNEISEEDSKDKIVIKTFADIPTTVKRKNEDVETEAPPSKIAKTEETVEKTETAEPAKKDEAMEVESTEKAEVAAAAEPEKMEETPAAEEKAVVEEKEKEKEEKVEEPKVETPDDAKEEVKEKGTVEVEEVTETTDGGDAAMETTPVVEEASNVEETATKNGTSEVEIEEVTAPTEETATTEEQKTVDEPKTKTETDDQKPVNNDEPKAEVEEKKTTAEEPAPADKPVEEVKKVEETKDAEKNNGVEEKKEEEKKTEVVENGKSAENGIKKSDEQKVDEDKTETKEETNGDGADNVTKNGKSEEKNGKSEEKNGEEKKDAEKTETKVVEEEKKVKDTEKVTENGSNTEIDIPYVQCH